MTFGTGTLQVGSSGDGVTELQQWLIDRGFLIALTAPNGTFDALTDQAVKAFQLSAGISCDGQVGNGTRAAADAFTGNAASGGWHPTAIRNVQQTSIGGSFLTDSRRGVLHTTETSSLPSYPNPPHFTVGRDGAGQPVQLWQHYPTTVAARALANPSGPPETNRWGAIQIEIIAMAADTSSMATADPDKFRTLGEWMRWVEANAGVANAASHSFDGPAAYGLTGSVRLSVADWEASSGWVGHQHVPQNAHWDPGLIDIAALLVVPAAGAAAPAPAAPTQGLSSRGVQTWGLAADPAIHRPTVRATTRGLSNAFPSLTLAVDPADQPYFEILLTTARALFDGANIAHRNAGNFFASRRDGLTKSDDAHGRYIAPVTVISAFAEANPNGGQVYYTVVAYADQEGNGPVPAADPAVLVQAAAGVPMLPGFTGHTRTEALGVPLGMLKPAARPAALALSPFRAAARPLTNDRGQGGCVGCAQQPAPGRATAFAGAGDLDRGEGEDGLDLRRRQVAAQPLPPVVVTPTPTPAAPAPVASPAAPAPGVPQTAVAPGTPQPGYDDGWGSWQAPPPPMGNAATRELGAAYPRGDGQPRNLSDSEDAAPAPADEFDDVRWAGAPYADQPPAAARAPDLGAQSPHSWARPEPPYPSPEQKRAIIETYVGPDTDLYAATSADSEYSGGVGTDHPAYHRYHVGLGFGIVGSSQDSGDLGQLLTLMNQRDHELFTETFGPDWPDLLDVVNRPGPLGKDCPDGRSARVQPVAGADAWTEPWLSRFQAAGRQLAFQGAQIELAAGLYLDPVLRFAFDLGIGTPRGLAIVFDRSAHRGVVGGMSWVVETVGPLQTPMLLDEALRTLGLAGVEAFQRSQPDLLVDDQFGPLTHAALAGCLRSHVASGGTSPVPLMDYRQMIEALGRRATGQPWGDRIVRLVGDPAIGDTVLPAEAGGSLVPR